VEETTANRVNLLLVGFFLGSFLNIEDGGDAFLRNVGIFPNNVALQLRRLYFS
jgi:hypothetical protein